MLSLNTSNIFLYGNLCTSEEEKVKYRRKEKPDPVKTLVWTEKQEKQVAPDSLSISIHVNLWDTQLRKRLILVFNTVLCS